MESGKLFSKDFFKTYGLLLGGCFIFAFGGVALIEPYGFAPGGTYGISMVFHHLWGWRTEVAAFCMDVPLFLIGMLIIGKAFGIKTAICSIVIPIFMWVIHQTYGFDSLIEPGIQGMDNLSSQLLASIFGGVVYGIGLGMIFKTRATSGGSDVISMILNKYTHISLGTLVIIVDGLITLSTVIAFGDWKLPMYSWIIIFIEGKVIDMIVEGSPMKTLLIVTEEPEKVKDIILYEIGRGATFMETTGAYKGKEQTLIYAVMSRREMISFRSKLAESDPTAFVNIIDSSEILGEGFNKIKE